MSVGELEITCNTSDVAVCCSRDSGKVSRACLHFIKQARVFDCNHRLISKGDDQLDLFLGEGTNLVARKGKHTNRDRFP